MAEGNSRRRTTREHPCPTSSTASLVPPSTTSSGERLEELESYAGKLKLKYVATYEDGGDVAVQYAEPDFEGMTMEERERYLLLM